MLPISSNNLPDLFSLLQDNISQKGVKKRLKLAFKKIKLDFHLTMPVLVALALNETCKDKNFADNKIKVLVHQLQNHDCIDHLRWVSLVPFLLGRPELTIEVVGVSSKEIKDNVSNARAVIDYFIANEPSAQGFKSMLLEGDIESLEELNAFDLIINNNASPQDLFKLTQSSLMKGIVDASIPYVLADFTQGGLLNNYNLFRNNGFSSSSDIFVNKHCSKFQPQMTSTEFGHGKFLLSIDATVDYEGKLTQMDFANYLSAIKSRLDHGDRLDSSGIAKTLSEFEVQLFPGVILNTQSAIVKVNHFGDHYSLDIDPKLAITPTETEALDNKADRLLWALSIYEGLISKIQLQQEKSA
jgi:hypothetical protein